MMTSFEDFTDSGSVALLESIKQEQRDLPAISAQVRGLAAALSSAPAPSFARLQGDWKLAFVSSEQGFSLIGTGLHKVFGTRMEELFVTFSGRRKARLIETTEVLRVIGPFPNVKNVLSGTIAFKEAGGGAAAIAAETGASLLTLTYSSMIEGTGRVLDGKENERVAAFWVRHLDERALVLEAAKASGSGKYDGASDIAAGELLVFEKEPDLAAEFVRLRIDVKE